MSDFFTFTVLGLALGSIYSIAAAGLVVTYTTSGIFNFAHGSIAMFAAFLYWQLRWDDGWLGQWPAPLAIIFVLFVAAPLFGIVVERLIIRGLYGAPEIVKIVVPVALLLFMTGAVNWIWGSLEARVPRPFFGATSSVTIGGVVITTHQIITFAAAILMAIGLWFLLNRTLLGVTMRAVVDNRELAQLNGGRPQVVSAASWAIGAFLAALAGVLIASLQNRSLDSLSLTLLVVNAYAAAVFGRLKSLPMTFLGGLIIGLAVNYWNWASNTGQRWTWLSNLRVSMPVILLFIVLILLPQERLREAVVSRTRERFRMPTITQAVVWGGVFVLVVGLLASLMTSAPENLLATGVALGIIGLSLVLLTGFAGEINLAPLTFAGLGAMVIYQFDVGPGAVAARESASVGGYVLAAAVAGFTGALIALPALRLRGLYLGLATFAFAVFVSDMVFKQISPLQLNIPWFGGGEDIEINLFTQGTLGVPRPNWFGVDFNASQTNYLILLACVFSILGVLLIVLRRSSYGRRLAAMKDSPAACATLGMNLVALKLSVFTVSAAIAGFGGALYAGQLRVVTEEVFTIFGSLALVLLVVVAGIGYVAGGLIGAFLAGAAFTVLGNTFDKLEIDYPSIGFAFDWTGSFFVFLGVGIAAIGLAKDPSGFLNDMFENYRVLTKRAAWPFVAGWVVVQALLYVLAVTDNIGNWTFVLVSIPLLLILPTLAVALRPTLVRPAEDIAAEKAAVPDDLVGIDRPFTEEDRDAYDEALRINA